MELIVVVVVVDFILHFMFITVDDILSVHYHDYIDNITGL